MIFPAGDTPLQMHRWISWIQWQFREPRLPLLPLEDPRLRERAGEVPGEGDLPVHETIRNLTEVLSWFRARHGAARGIAATQIGILQRIILLDDGEGPIPLINPVIQEVSREEQAVWERCMSFPHLVVLVRRPVNLSVTYRAPDGTPDAWIGTGPDLAPLVQHEVDHLDGVLTTDRAWDRESVVPWDDCLRNRKRYEQRARDAMGDSPR